MAVDGRRSVYNPGSTTSGVVVDSRNLGGDEAPTDLGSGQ
jgi:hypothetical protein